MVTVPSLVVVRLDAGRRPAAVWTNTGHAPTGGEQQVYEQVPAGRSRPSTSGALRRLLCETPFRGSRWAAGVWHAWPRNG